LNHFETPPAKSARGRIVLAEASSYRPPDQDIGLARPRESIA
jgi:hypothetical protein